MALLVCIPAVCSSKFIYIFKQTLIFLDVEQAVFEIGVIFVVVLATSTGFFFLLSAFCTRRSGATAACCVIHAGLSVLECGLQHIL